MKKVNFEFTDLKEGIKQSVIFFITNHDNLRK